MNHRAAIPLLILLLPLVWRAAYASVVLATENRALSRMLAPGIGLAAWLLAIHVVGLLSHSYYAGLIGGTVLVAALGGASFRLKLPTEGRSSRASRWMFVGMLVAVLPMVGPELRWSVHDECLVTSHISIPLEMQNGIYPPRHLTFPQFELRYHYAIDLAGAAFSSLLGNLDMKVAVHLLAILLWGYTFCLLWTWGQRCLGGRYSGPVAAVTTLFAAGFPAFCRSLQPLSLYLVSDCRSDEMWITPPVISNFLQHPWSLGIPLWIALLLIFDCREAAMGSGGRAVWWWATMTVLALALSLSQVVLFFCLVASVIAVGCLDGFRLSPGRILLFIPWGLAVLRIAILLRGFFATVAEPQGIGIEFHPFWTDHRIWQWASWHLQSFGFLLPLGLLGLAFVRKERLLFSLLVAGSLLVRSFFRYTHSWDIVKFTMVTQVAFALLSAAVLTRAFESRKFRLLGVLGLAGCIAFGVGWSVALSLDMPKRFFCKELGPRPGPDQAAIDFLRLRIGAGEGVFRTENADAYSAYGGLPQPNWDAGVLSFGFSDWLFSARQTLMQNPSAAPEDYSRQAFQWMVLGPKDGQLLTFAERWAADGRAQLAAEFPPLRVYHLAPSP
jgi:hypothetical protein